MYQLSTKLKCEILSNSEYKRTETIIEGDIFQTSNGPARLCMPGHTEKKNSNKY